MRRKGKAGLTLTGQFPPQPAYTDVVAVHSGQFAYPQRSRNCPARQRGTGEYHFRDATINNGPTLPPLPWNTPSFTAATTFSACRYAHNYRPKRAVTISPTGAALPALIAPLASYTRSRNPPPATPLPPRTTKKLARSTPAWVKPASAVANDTSG